MSASGYSKSLDWLLVAVWLCVVIAGLLFWSGVAWFVLGRLN